MANKAKIYGEVLKAVLQKASAQKRKKVIQNFKQLVKKHGDTRFLRNIIKEFEFAWKTRQGNVASAVFAKDPSYRMRDAMKKKLQKIGFVYEEKIDSRLVGGVAIFLGNDYLVDNSIQGKLNKVAHLL